MARKQIDPIKSPLFQAKQEEWIESIGQSKLIEMAKQMILIRHFEMRAESAYQRGLIGGFFHAYMGQEAIQTAAVGALGGEQNWWITTYRCHALALLLGVSPAEAMAELYGKVTGNALGRGGSMHLYSDRMLGGFGIVGGHIPIATGAAFSLKYQKQDGVAICFLGDGAVAQGAFHESLNLASLWDLPCIYVVENNKWGMGTAVSRAICVESIADHFSKSYDMKGYRFDGMDLFNCYAGFTHVKKEVKQTGRPVLVEAITERFRGHSISDPGFYRSKEELKKVKARDPIPLFTEALKKHHILSQKELEAIDQEQKAQVMAAMQFAEESPPPQAVTLEEGVFAPEHSEE